MSIQVVAQYPEHGFSVLEDELGQFLQLADKDQIVPLRDNPKMTTASLLRQLTQHHVAAVERAFT